MTKHEQMRHSLFVGLLLLFLLIAGCGSAAKKQDAEPEKNPGQKTESVNRAAGEKAADRDVAGQPKVNAAEQPEADTSAQPKPYADELAGGGSGSLTYEVKHCSRAYQADDGTVIFETSLAYPLFAGNSPGISNINRFFENWKQTKLQEYESQEFSVRQAALEVYRESRDTGWPGPWSEAYRVRSVKTYGGYVSILLDARLQEGETNGIPCRENYLFRLSDGEKIPLTKMTALGREEWNDLLKEAFLKKVQQDHSGTFYGDAKELIGKKNMEETGFYFAENGVAFYLQPYEIAPAAAGYVEITIPYEKAGFETYKENAAGTY